MDLPFAFTPQLFVLLVALCALLVVGFSFRKKTRTNPPDSYPYVAALGLFTPAERAFLRQLEAALQGQPYRVFGKVRLGDLLEVEKGLAKGARRGALNRISSKHVDFVVCSASDVRVACAIELDDKTHRRTDRKLRDAFLERALEAAGVPSSAFRCSAPTMCKRCGRPSTHLDYL